MNEIMRNECCQVASEAVRSADIKITLEQWPCAVAYSWWSDARSEV